MKRDNQFRHKPPSRVRYEALHPVVSFRIKSEHYDQLQELLRGTGKSFADFVKEGLKVQKANTTRAYNHGWNAGYDEGWNAGYEEGYAEAKRLYRIPYPCKVCGSEIEATSAAEKQAVAEYMKEHRWGHSQCLEKRKYAWGI